MEDASLAAELEEIYDDSDYVEAVGFWEKKQRELVVSVVDYNLSSLVALVKSATIDLSPRYQRRHRWDNKRRSALIESFLMNVPVPPIFLNEDRVGRYSVIDGKQRLTAITEFFNNSYALTGLKLFGQLDGAHYSNLPTDLRDAINTRSTLRATIILRQSDRDVKRIVFRRLNTGGVTANAQEVRNAAYPGRFNDLLIELSELPLLRDLLHISNLSTSQMYQQMRDVELVLRYFTFRDNWKTFARGVAASMDEFMELKQQAPKREIAEMRQDFLEQLNAVHIAFGDKAFLRYVPESEKWRAQVIAAVYDAEMFAVHENRPSILAKPRPIAPERIADLFSVDEFRAAIDAATNSSAAFRERINLMRALIKSQYL
jgi:hypothetical protein